MYTEYNIASLREGLEGIIEEEEDDNHQGQHHSAYLVLTPFGGGGGLKIYHPVLVSTCCIHKLVDNVDLGLSCHCV